MTRDGRGTTDEGGGRRAGARPRIGVPLAAWLFGGVVALLSALASCGPSQPNTDIRMWTDSLEFRISMDPLPPRANERIVYKVVVRDKESGEPVEGGEGRIFAMSRDSVRTWDALEPGPELGTYYAHLRYITAGQWAVGMQFRRDSLHAIERMDWMQDVRAAH